MKESGLKFFAPFRTKSRHERAASCIAGKKTLKKVSGIQKSTQTDFTICLCASLVPAMYCEKPYRWAFLSNVGEWIFLMTYHL